MDVRIAALVIVAFLLTFEVVGMSLLGYLERRVSRVAFLLVLLCFVVALGVLFVWLE